MSSTGLQRLEVLRKKNTDPTWINRDLYRLMYKDDLYTVAYERIKSKPGNMTAGTDGTTLDGFSQQEIRLIIKRMRAESYTFLKGRRVYIPKANGKKRALTIAPPREKVVQEVIRMLLESIYDSEYGATFTGRSHGFRAGKGTHTALKEVRTWQGVSWLVEGDIKGCYDNIDHSILMSLLRKRIKDEKFLNLIWKMLRAGYTDGSSGNHFSSLSGTPQGGIASPVTANIYLHEFDLFMEQLVENYEKGVSRRANPAYRHLASRKANGKKRKADSLEMRELDKELRRIPSLDPNDPNFIRIKYIRYADDWMIGVVGSKALAVDIRDQVATWLEEKLSLTLSLEKTHIRHAKTEEALFLGTRISVGSISQPVGYQIRNGQKFRRRSSGWSPVMKAPTKKIVEKLSLGGFCDRQGKSNAKCAWMNFNAVEIINRYNAVLHGIVNYYSFVDNYSSLLGIQNILHMSAAKTLASKWRIPSVKQVFRKFGKELYVETTTANGRTVKAEFKLIKSWNRDRWRFKIKGKESPTGDLKVLRQYAKYTQSRLGDSCAVCGSDSRVQMHHIRHVRKAGEKAKGFAKILSQINRKQIPVCHGCHLKIHNGTYDGISLSQLAYIPN